ncbi:MAG: translation initiation factor IF-2 [Parcubacteria group bacterium CG_4_9_14_0_2_um_filter_41_8]|nr:MAG: translation initiation factor IF-2 [Parcubacteria group bacterium CG_4_9_14_0_2_um_filter_41_8]
MNVTELARQLKTTKEELLEKLPVLGFDIGLRAIKIDNSVAERIRQAWSKEQRRQKIREKMDKQEIAKSKQGAESTAIKDIIIPEKIAVTNLAVKLGTEVTHLIGYLMKNGIMAALNEQIDFDTASIVAEDYGFKAVKGAEEDHQKQNVLDIHEMKKTRAKDTLAQSRPPVVVVMGHVDHGKTTLLDAIRKTNVVATESGGITQHIGAYQVEEKGRVITFLDTPGHEAFKAMRERGGQVADIAILIVAADDGLKPQTLESINVIQKENLPFVVAINKVDKPGADIDRVKKELAEINLNPEDWGGKTICVPISAKKGEKIDDLLDMVLLVADMEKFTADPLKPAHGVIIESHIDKGEGPVATVLVNVGTLRVGDEIAIGETYGKIKSLKDWTGTEVKEAPPSMPVKILGLKSTPKVGDILKVEAINREKRKKNPKNYHLVDIEQNHALSKYEQKEDNANVISKNRINIIVKADMLGSLEALIASIKKLENNHVSIGIIKQGLGNITESDLILAKDSSAIIYGFNINLSQEALRLSYERTVEIKISKIIYELLDDLTAKVKSFIKTEIVEVKQGDLLVLKVFKDSKKESIIGCRAKAAPVAGNSKFRLLRDGEPIDEGQIVEIQRNKQAVEKAEEGAECGIKVTNARGFKEGDILSCFIEEEREV